MGFPLTRDDFPASIAPMTARELPEIKKKLGGSEFSPISARENYARLSGQIVFLTGHQYAHDRQGRAYTRQEWEDVMHKCLSHLNDELMLGLSKEALDVLTLCYTVLTETPRYGGDPVIGRKEGENTGVHSLHTMLQAQYIYQKALEENQWLADDVDFFRNFQLTCLLLSVHDLGELLGEAGSLAAVADKGTFAVKDKTEFERGVFNFAVRLAVQTVTDKRPTHEFYDRIDAVRSLMNVQNKGTEKTDEQLAAELARHMKENIRLNYNGEKLFGFLKQAWEWVEEPAHSKSPFLGHLAAVCERMQGTRHLNRQMADSPRSLVHGTDGRDHMIRVARLTDSQRILVNADYVEGKLGFLCDAVDKRSPCEKTLAEQTAKRVYETMKSYLISMPDAFFRAPVKETRLHNDGTPFTPSEAEARQAEIKIAESVAQYEAGELQKIFSDVCLVTGRTALTNQQASALYQRAIDRKYLPRVIDQGGKKTAEILIHALPDRLTGLIRMPKEDEERITAQIEAMIPAEMKPVPKPPNP